jgi:hypothetical protein
MKKKPANPRSAATETISESIERMLDSFRLQGKYNETLITSRWESLMGQVVASRTGRMYFKNKVLFLEILSAPLKKELQMHKVKLIARLNEATGAETVKDVIFL